MYAIIAKNTNLYAISSDAPTTRTETNSQYWFPTNEDEIRVLFGILYYMGVHREPQYTVYQETERVDGPNHTISKHMSLNRYENLRRHLHISPPNPVDAPIEPLKNQDASKLPQSCLRDPKDLEFQWWRLEPMLGTFCNAC